MKILAFEFSTLRRSVAVLDIDAGVAKILSSITDEPRKAGSPFPLIEKVLGDIQREEIEGIAVGLGPGSYTGIRSALAIAQGWNLSRSVLAAGISTADAIAFRAWKGGRRGECEVVIDAQRNEVYSAIYNLNEGGFSLVAPLEIFKVARTNTVLEFAPDAESVGSLAANAKFGPPEILEPIYLREPSFVKAPAVRHS
jgi:tRNA threonylcarbamoyladenosine biosynthesis protein TsaB